MSVYFGGSRNLKPSQVLASIANAVLLSGQSIHVGCQAGADQQVIRYVSGCYSGQFNSSLVVFAVAPFSSAPDHVVDCDLCGAMVHYSAGGSSAPMPARYLLRSIAAFQGCSQAVFFSPGPGSLAVARECLKAGIPVYAFGQSMPAPIPAAPGFWVASQFMGFACFYWQRSQQSLF